VTRTVWASLLALALALALAACGPQTPVRAPAYHADNPETLSAWGQFVRTGETIALSEGVTPYDLNTPLFTDYAQKFRTIWMPEGAAAGYRDGEVLDFPVGTVITKTFYYPEGASGAVLKSSGAPQGERLDLSAVRLIETRLLIRDADGWRALPYVWNADESDAVLMRGGAVERLTLADADASPRDFAYIVPDANQCAGCHAVNNTTRRIEPIGPKPRNLNKAYAFDDGARNQIARLIEQGRLINAPDLSEIPRLANWRDASEPLNARARAYLDVNCAHCHNPWGPADTSGLHLNVEAPVGPNLGLCKPPIAAGRGSGGLRFSLVPGAPERSILLHRMISDEPDVMMPEIGRALAHAEGVALIEAWIGSLDGGCPA